MSQGIEFYSQSGDAICYSPDGQHIFLWNGKPVGYFHGEVVYSFSGRVLGWLGNGWLHDRNNKPALFSKSARGGPFRPPTRILSLKSLRQLLPLKSLRDLPQMKPHRKLDWSHLSGDSYFSQ